MPSPTELLVIFAIILVLFGASKIPALGKGLGEGIRNFKKGLSGDEPDKGLSGDEPGSSENSQR